MFDHVTIRVSDRHVAERAYQTLLGAPSARGEDFTEWEDFSLAAPAPGRPITRRLHVGFGVASRAEVDAFWRRGVDAGLRSDGEPGPRPQYVHDYYGGFLLDPDGNSIEAVHYDGVRVGGVDHLWIRVADVAASRDFYAAIAPAAGLRLQHDDRSLARFAVGERSSFSVLDDGEPTEGLHMAFGASSNDLVDEFHRLAIAAGHPDDGAPGERARYHPGYYAAYALDPDGHSVEVVSHNR